MRKLAMWIVNNIPCGRLAPYLFGFAIKRKGYKGMGISGDIGMKLEEKTAEMKVRNIDAALRIIALVEKKEQLIQDANAYLSGGGCGAKSIQEAARLYKRMKNEKNK